MKQIDSETITSLVAPGSAIGTPHGGSGLATPDATAVASWLSGQCPDAVDRAALSRASRHGAELRVRYEGRYPSGPNGERLPSYMVATGCTLQSTEEARRAALADMRKFLTPAPQREIEAWLAELSVIVVRRAQGEFDEALRLEAYAGRLRAFPADVARAAVLGRSWQFWPSWAELEAECNRLASPRRAMLAALERPLGAPEPPRIAPDDAAKDRFRREIEAFEQRAKPHEPRLPHWSETAAPDDPRWAEVRRARKAAGVTA
jgi:hypothetical protein